MGQTAIISQQILDSTSLGRDLIAAADQAAAQAIIGVTGVDTGADYNWTGDHQFSGTVTTSSIVSSTSLDLDVDEFVLFRYNGNLSFIASFSAFYSNNSKSLGTVSKPWGTVISENGSFSGNLVSEVGGSQKFYNLGTEGDTDTEYLETSWDANVGTISAKQTGTGVVRDLNFDGHDGTFSGRVLTKKLENLDGYSYIRVGVQTSSPIKLWRNTAPQGDNAFDMGADAERFRTVYSVDGDFSGTVTTDAIDSTGSLIVSNNGTQKLEITSSRIRPSVNFFPLNDNFVVCGQEGSRWKSVASVNGSFSGNLNTEVGGSQRVYNLGTEGDTDTEYLETVVDSGVYCIRTGATGTGTAIKSVYLGTGFSGTNVSRGITVSNSSANFNFGGTRFNIAGGQITTYTKFLPATDATYACGEDGKRWSSVSSISGDFSGDVVIGGAITNTDANNLLSLDFSGVEQYSFRSNALVPKGTAKSSGLSAARWTNTYSVDGSYSGNLNTEVGGSQRVYNLGTEGDADTEYLDISATANEYYISPKVTGAGAGRDLFITGSYGAIRAHLEFQNNGNLKIAYGSNAHILVGGTYVKFRTNVDPNVDNTYTMGTSSIRWANTYSVAGDFSGTITNSATTGWSATFSRAIRVGPDSGVGWFYGNGNMTKFNTPVTFEASFQFGRPADGYLSRLYRMSKTASAFTCVAVDAGVSSSTVFQVEDATSTFQPLRTGGYVNHYPSNSGEQAYRMYNLGEVGDTDTEYGGFDFTTNVFRLGTQTTGTGVARDVGIIRDNQYKMYFGSSTITTYTSVQPSGNGTHNLGSGTRYYARNFAKAVFTNTETVTASTASLATTDTTRFCDCTSNSIAITIPSSSTAQVGNEYRIKKTDSSANTVTITPDSPATIDGAASVTLTAQYEAVTLVSDGTNWFIV